MPRVEIAAPAKVNLHLEVLDQRPDGLHELLSLFQTVSLADSLLIETTGEPGAVQLRGTFDLPARDNLAVRAAEQFRFAAGLREGVVINVVKRIPLGGGFGGGSSDAAATLRGLQRLFGEPLDPAALAAIAPALGSDVPFFLAAAAAVVEGRGERVQPVAARCDFALVALTPTEGVSTAQAFRWLDADRPPAGLRTAAATAREIERAYRQDPVASWPFANSFDGPVFARLPAGAAARERLLAAGAAAARLTGSGSTVIGIFADPGRAAAAARSIARDPPAGIRPADVRLLQPLDSAPPTGYYR